MGPRVVVPGAAAVAAGAAVARVPGFTATAGEPRATLEADSPAAVGPQMAVAVLDAVGDAVALVAGSSVVV